MSDPLTYASGATIWQAGELPVTLQVVSGLVAYVCPGGYAALVLLGPGECITPEPGVHPQQTETAPYDLRAITPVTLVPAERIRFTNGARALARARCESLTWSLPQRVAALLLRGPVDESGWFRARQDLIAFCAAGRRETVALHLSAWRDAELIDTRYRRVRVKDRAGLLAAVGLSEADVNS